MTTVTVLAAGNISQSRLKRKLTRSGYATVPDDGGVRVSRHGRWDVVTISAAQIADLPEESVEAAKRLLGLLPRAGVTCRFEDAVGSSDSWPTVVDIARAVAAEVPLAILDDHAGTRYLVHPQRGLIGPEEYEQVRGRPTTADFLRRLIGG